MDHCVFIHTGQKQIVGALVSAWSIRRNSCHGDRFKVRIVYHNDYALMHEREGQFYLHDGAKRRWRNNKLYSFIPLRFTPPELMNYSGRAVVIEPDVFAVGDIWELLSRDMQDKAIMCRACQCDEGETRGCLSSSVMLLDCARLTHWRFAEQFGEMFESRRDYKRWMRLLTEPPETVGMFGQQWNSFDRVNGDARIVRFTRRRTRPWEAGYPGRYKSHLDRGLEQLFFGLLRECMDNGIVTEHVIREQIRQDHMRHDMLEILDRTPPLAPVA